ncbi:MAG: GAF domain-containing protein, partial [Actinomycetota bacterium]|nr:GAF domain-containing protein [Actinomycetota bacterium]
MSDPRQQPPSESWSTRQLSDFLTLVSSFEDERSATIRLVERAAEVFAADAACLVERGDLVVAAGPRAGALTATGVRAAASGRRNSVSLGSEPAAALCAEAGDHQGRMLVIARAHPEFTRAEEDLARGLGRVMALGSRTLSLVDTERGMRASSESQAAENERLLEALRDRQAMLERLAAIQRAIVAQKPLHDIFDQVVEAASELIGDRAGMMRMRDADGSERSTVVSSVGLSEHFLSARRRSHDPGLGARAIQEGRFVVVDKSTDPFVDKVPDLWRFEGLHAGMAAPVLQGTTVVGSVVTASDDPNRAYSARDQQSLLALAEHASLAL